ncbi:hypothetical protein PM082_009266 [Marasmius tenuissimus]|nr:hypothetical protein PM082_009266 [Marasmius tenuissimus]
MSHPLPDSCSKVHIGRDQNVNHGHGPYTVNYDNRVIQHRTRSTYRHIQGQTEEEEAEYEEYGEYRHGDIQIIGTIHSEKLLGKFDWMTMKYAPFDCQKSVMLGRIVSGEGVGTMVTVEAYEGSDAPEEWKEHFVCHTTGQSL